MTEWLSELAADPLPWLLDAETPAVRHLTLRRLFDRATDAPDVVAARASAMSTNPIAAILEAQNPEGWWVAPGPGYLPKYSATTWQLSFLDQMGADGTDPRVQATCEYVLQHTQTSTGAFGVLTRGDRVPPPSGAIHCLNGNLLRSLLGFGWLDDARVQRSIEWHAAVITGDPSVRYYGYTPSPGFSCGANDRHACAWGAAKALAALARVPVDRRSPAVQSAIGAGVEFLLSRDPAVADYPTAVPGAKPSGSWFKLGFPSGYVCDVLQVLKALVDAGAAADPRLDNAVEWLLQRQDGEGRWTNDYTYTGKMIVNVDAPRRPSKWVTLHACTVVKAVAEARRPQ